MKILVGRPINLYSDWVVSSPNEVRPENRTADHVCSCGHHEHLWKMMKKHVQETHFK